MGATMSLVEEEKVAHLKANADEGSEMSYVQAKRWAAIYYFSRGSVILFSGLTSAQALSTASFFTYAQPVFALLVTLITGFDVWLKPGTKYRALYVANDEYAELRQKLELVPANDTKQLIQCHQEYSQINKRLQNALMP
jgi:hypothetical protein